MAGLRHLALRKAVVAAARRLGPLGINQGTSGNVSVRAGDGLLVTPSGIPYDELTPGQIVWMDLEGRFEGDWLPSSEWRFHCDILRARPDLNAVVHTHAVHATALACHGKGIPAFHYMVAAAGGRDIRCAPYATFGTAELSANAVLALDGRTGLPAGESRNYCVRIHAKRCGGARGRSRNPGIHVSQGPGNRAAR